MAAKSVSLPKSNLHLTGFGRDTNGNKVIKLSFPQGRGFSIQTLGNMPKTHSMATAKTKVSDLSGLQMKTIGSEAVKYIKKFGSDMQKKKLRVY